LSRVKAALLVETFWISQVAANQRQRFIFSNIRHLEIGLHPGWAPASLIPEGSRADGDQSASELRHVCDYIAGMTDGFTEKFIQDLGAAPEL
jgi:dGTP triphosphohydrolase